MGARGRRRCGTSSVAGWQLAAGFMPRPPSDPSPPGSVSDDADKILEPESETKRAD